MTHESPLDQDWDLFVERLGGAEELGRSAKQTRAFLRGREFKNAVDLLRMLLAYCLGKRGLRLTSAWAASVGLADVSNVALLYRLRQSGDWLTHLVEQALICVLPATVHGRLIRIVDATTVPKAGASAKRNNRLWRIHGAFDLPLERFGCFELTDETGGERLDRSPVVAGEIRLGDRAYLQPERMAAVLSAGADIVIRAGWKGARWLDADGKPVDLIGMLEAEKNRGLIDRPVWIGRKSAPPLALRLIAIKKPPHAAEAAARKVHREAQRGRHRLQAATLVAADWIILVTSLSTETVPAADVLALYRLRWRIELAFKRLKSLIGLQAPPGVDERSAKPYLLAHLLVILLLEPLIDELEDSPRLALAA
jgi:Transposase DDE domain